MVAALVRGVGAADLGGARESVDPLPGGIHPRYPKIVETLCARCTPIRFISRTRHADLSDDRVDLARGGVKSSFITLAPGPRSPMRSSSSVASQVWPATTACRESKCFGRFV